MNLMVAVPPKMLIASLKRLKSGGLTVKSKDTNIIEVKVEENEIAIDVQSMDTVKKFITPLQNTRFSFSSADEHEETSILHQLQMLKTFANELKKAKMTVSVKDAGDPILVIGDKAKPRLSKLILGSNIQASVTKILSLIRKLR